MITTAVKEFLRYDTSFQRAWRLTAEDAEIGGKLIPKGQTVSLMLGAANRAPARFSDPDRLRLVEHVAALFDSITRTPNRHVAFSQSVHACLGAPLARREGEIVFTTLLRRFPKLRLAESTGTIAWQPNNTFHNLKSLSGTFA